MSWQKCPVCNGDGTITPALPQGIAGGITHPIQCTTCNGSKIINAITGQPPALQTQAPAKPDELSEQQIKDAFKELSPFDDMDDDEIKYWATPYYDELQARKRAKKDAVEQTTNAYEAPPAGRQRAN